MYANVLFVAVCVPYRRQPLYSVPTTTSNARWLCSRCGVTLSNQIKQHDIIINSNCYSQTLQNSRRYFTELKTTRCRRLAFRIEFWRKDRTSVGLRGLIRLTDAFLSRLPNTSKREVREHRSWVPSCSGVVWRHYPSIAAHGGMPQTFDIVRGGVFANILPGISDPEELEPPAVCITVGGDLVREHTITFHEPRTHTYLFFFFSPNGWWTLPISALGGTTTHNKVSIAKTIERISCINRQTEK